jgi:hypothetical protein
MKFDLNFMQSRCSEYSGQTRNKIKLTQYTINLRVHIHVIQNLIEICVKR